MTSTDAVRRIMRRRGANASLHVHFHNSGPDRQPVPCFDLRCPYPRLNVGDRPSTV
jgi:hypothetical protein